MLFLNDFSLKSGTYAVLIKYKQHVFMALRDVIVKKHSDYLIEGLQFYIRYRHPTSILEPK